RIRDGNVFRNTSNPNIRRFRARKQKLDIWDMQSVPFPVPLLEYNRQTYLIPFLHSIVKANGLVENHFFFVQRLLLLFVNAVPIALTQPSALCPFFSLSLGRFLFLHALSLHACVRRLRRL